MSEVQLTRRQFLKGSVAATLAGLAACNPDTGASLTDGEKYGEIIPLSEVDASAIEKVRQSLARLRTTQSEWEPLTSNLPSGRPAFEPSLVSNVVTANEKEVIAATASHGVEYILKTEVGQPIGRLYATEVTIAGVGYELRANSKNGGLKVATDQTKDIALVRLDLRVVPVPDGFTPEALRATPVDPGWPSGDYNADEVLLLGSFTPGLTEARIQAFKPPRYKDFSGNYKLNLPPIDRSTGVQNYVVPALETQPGESGAGIYRLKDQTEPVLIGILSGGGGSLSFTRFNSISNFDALKSKLYQ